MRRRSNSIFFRMFIMFIILFLPIYMMFARIYSTSVSFIRKEVLQLAESQTENFLNDLENEIERIQMLLYQIVLNDENMRLLASIPEINGQFGKTMAIKNVRNTLDIIGYSSSYINDVRIHFPNLYRTVSVNDGYNEFNEKEYKEILKLNNNDDSVIQYINNCIIIYVSDIVKIENYPRFIIVIELSYNQIKTKLEELNYMDKSWTVLESTELGLNIKTNNDKNINSEKNIKATSKIPYIVTIDGEKYLLIKKESKYLKMSLTRYIPYKELFNSLNILKSWIWISVLSAFCVIVIYGLATYNIVTKPINRLVILLKQVEQGNYQSYLDYDIKDEFKYIYQQFNAMVEKIKYLIDQVYKREIYIQKAELKQLQAQINPHFLYNIFFNISVMAENRQYEALQKLTYNLGEYFRFITKNLDKDIELKEEIRHAQIYADIQAMRFSNRIQIEFEPIPEQYESRMVPRLIIQPIVENAFIHGLKNKLEGGKLQVTYETMEDTLIIVISDNSGIVTELDIEKLYTLLYNEESINSVSGLSNVNRRIRLKFGKDSGLYPFRNKYGGLTVNMKLSFNEQSEG